ncbi:adenylate/guanylate cyclase domain-containing protein [Mycolicibacterium fallax]|uniref:adenylate/guanylate cyclase domain-containing protein n=1 Tax=Mycolicibacterium fallax TaxID=1793 RepID=UPI000D6D36B2|nr:adenylate/guanylate cyclase domain-containing protein [Mycolicibacterium fallax]BBZ00470.1 adenylate/guanylate cyclase domain-containing protein [Mycolicibacterium fallax]HOW93543.1 adenylate cyclase regulatory domain-containing protein [Mycolicibacterium fallax]HSA41142.1 adenylate cyclase regulatory domain-containing protein [Mycobacterium sp.]
MSVDPRIENSSLFDGLSGTRRDERIELVDWLLSRGYPFEEIESTVSPVLMASRRVIGDDGDRVSTREIAANTGLDLALQERVLRALGLHHVQDPDEKAYLRADGEATFHTAQFVRMGFDTDELLRIARVLAEGLTPVAEMMRNAALSMVMKPGLTELEIAQRSERMMEAAAPVLGPMITDLLMLKLRNVMQTEAVTEAERAEGAARPGAREVAVAFADLVDFTGLGEVLPPEDIEDMALRLSDTAREVIDPPVRLVKTIGDAVMMVCPEPLALLNAMLDLADAAEADPGLPRLRTGMAWGSAMGRSGDWFGAPVNLASRVTAAARPGRVLAAESLKDVIDDEVNFEWKFVGARKLKGITGETKLYRVKRAGTR